MGLEETITKMKTDAMQANADNLQAKKDAMRAIGGNLSKLRQAMARQKEYDITTVKSVSDRARILLDAGLFDDLHKLVGEDNVRLMEDGVRVNGRGVWASIEWDRSTAKACDVICCNRLRNLPIG